MLQTARWFIYLAALSSCLLPTARSEDWPCWRGPRGDGSSAEIGAPVHWSPTDNIIWKTAIPGEGHASPIVWGDRIFTVTALVEQNDRVLVCLDRWTGKLLWQRTVVRSPLESKHRLNSYASSTPATDGESVYCTFLHGQGILVAAYDFQGNQKWSVRPGEFKSVHGFCSSPVLFKDMVIVNGDHDGDAYLVAIDCATGGTRWKAARENKTRSYSTPIIREIDG